MDKNGDCFKGEVFCKYIVLDKLFLVWIGEKGDEKSILYDW